MAETAAGPEPAGSMAPITMNQGKWHRQIDAAGLTELNALADDINKVIDSTQKTVCRAQIKVGKLLLEARELFVGDKEFGQWRAEKTSIGSNDVARKLMNVARDFKDAPAMIEACNHSVLVELVTAPPAYTAAVAAAVEKGEAPPTVKEVRKAKASAATSPARMKVAPVANIAPPKRTSKDREVLEMGFPRRSDAVRDMADTGRNNAEWSYILFGLDPDPTCPINEVTLRYIYEGYLEGLSQADADLLEEAYEHIQSDIRNFD